MKASPPARITPIGRLGELRKATTSTTTAQLPCISHKSYILAPFLGTPSAILVYATFNVSSLFYSMLVALIRTRRRAVNNRNQLCSRRKIQVVSGPHVAELIHLHLNGHIPHSSIGYTLIASPSTVAA